MLWTISLYCRQSWEKANEPILRGLWLHKTSAEDLPQELESCDSYEEEIIRVSRLLKSRMCLLESSEDPASSKSTRPSSEFVRINNQLKLPELPLPKYSHGEGESMELFFENFESIINKYSLSGP